MSKLWHNQNSSMFHVPVPSHNSATLWCSSSNTVNCNVANILAVSGPLCPHGSLTVLHLRSGHRGARVLDESCHSSCSHLLWTTQRMIHFRLMWYRYYWDILEFHCPCFLSSLNGQWKTWSSLKFLLHVFFYLILKIKFGTKLAKVVFRKKTPKFSDS